MSTVSLLSEQELDAVHGGSWSFNVVGLAVQVNNSVTNQGQANLNFGSVATRQGGAQIAVTTQSNSIG